MAARYRTHPSSSQLSHERTWTCVGPDGHGPYRAVRYNLILDEVGRESPSQRFSFRPRHRNGFESFYDQRPIRLVESIAGLALSEQVTTVAERHFASLESTIQESVFTQETVAALNARIPWGKSGGVGTEARATVTDSLRSLTTIERRWEERESQSRTVSVDLDQRASETRVIQAAPYLKITYDAYLVYADYLQVEYAKRALRLRVERVKSPPLGNDPTKTHRNIIMFNIPLGRFVVFERLGTQDMSYVSPERFARFGVDPQQVTVSPIPHPKRHEVRAFREVPTLYRISNATFPLKADQRSTFLSEADIMGYDEDEAVNTAWRWEVRRHRRRR